MNRRQFMCGVAAAALVAVSPALADRRPLRLAAFEGYPGYAEWRELLAQGRKAVVTLDGVEQRHCAAADEIDGFIVRAVTDDKGQLILDHTNERALTEKVYGNVRIEII